MGAAFTAEDLVLLGYDDIKSIDVGEEAIAFSGKAKAGIVQTEHNFVYVKTDATKEDLIRISSKVQSRGNLYVLRSKSGPAESLVKSAFGKALAIYQIEELLWARVSELFKAYAENISESIPTEPHYIAPRGSAIDIKDRLDEYLIEYFTKSTPSRGVRKNLVVLKANAGVGKTTLCRRLAKEFARKIGSYKVVPVYVEAAHWGGRVSNTSDLWDIIQLSLQNFDSGSGISRGLFEAALRRGLILFVFDGFDELCSSPRSNISARDVIEALTQIAEDSEARIVLTTRTPYWANEIGEDPQEVHSLELLAFNPQQAKEYIRKFFTNEDALFDTARHLYADVIAYAEKPDNKGGARAQFWSLPIAVSMICEAVKAGVSRSDWQAFSLETLLVAICERESKRQNLNISGAKQISIFKEIALLDSAGAATEFSQDDVLAAGVSDQDAGKFLSHPLLRSSGVQYSFAYDFLGPYLRALAVKDEFLSVDQVRKPILEAMRAEENGKGFLLEHLSRLVGGNIDSVYSLLERVPKSEAAARSFLIHLLLRTADQQSDVVNSADRTAVFLRGIGSNAGKDEVSDTRFVGSLDRLDLSNVEFVGCEFRDVGFKDVDFSGTTFRRCIFDGEVDFANSQDGESFASASVLPDCELRGGARLALEPLLLNNPENRLDLIKDLLEAALSKFWHNGRFRATVRRADWKKGQLGRSRSSAALLDVFEKHGLLQEVTISGVQEGGLVFNRASIGDLQNFMDHRQLSGAILAAFSDLERTLGKSI